MAAFQYIYEISHNAVELGMNVHKIKKCCSLAAITNGRSGILWCHYGIVFGHIE